MNEPKRKKFPVIFSKFTTKIISHVCVTDRIISELVCDSKQDFTNNYNVYYQIIQGVL